MQNTACFNCNFKSKRIKEWFNNNYFISVYDMNDNYITSFENIEEPSKFFNIPLFKIIERLRNNQYIVYNGRLVKMYIFEKEKETKIESRKR